MVKVCKWKLFSDGGIDQETAVFLTAKKCDVLQCSAGNESTVKAYNDNCWNKLSQQLDEKVTPKWCWQVVYENRRNINRVECLFKNLLK